MPSIFGPTAPATGLPDEDLLQQDEGGLTRKLLGGVGAALEAIDTPQDLLFGMLSGKPGTKVDTADEVLAAWGVPEGGDIDPTVGRVAQATTYGGIGFLIGGPIGAAILGTIGALIPAPKNARQILAMPAELLVDPLMLLGPIGRATKWGGPAGERFLGQAWTKLGFNTFNELKQLPKPARVLSKAAELTRKAALAGETVSPRVAKLGAAVDRWASEKLIADAGGVEKAMASGLLDKGGIHILHWSVPGTPKAMEVASANMKRFFSQPAFQPMARFLNIQPKMFDDPNFTGIATFREVDQIARTHSEEIDRALKKAGLADDPEVVGNWRAIIGEAGRKGADIPKAIRKAVPGLSDAKIEKMVPIVQRFKALGDEALRMGQQSGELGDRLDDELKRTLDKLELRSEKIHAAIGQDIATRTGVMIHDIRGDIDTLMKRRDAVAAELDEATDKMGRTLIAKGPKARGAWATANRVSRLADKIDDIDSRIAKFHQDIGGIEKSSTTEYLTKVEKATLDRIADERISIQRAIDTSPGYAKRNLSREVKIWGELARARPEMLREALEQTAKRVPTTAAFGRVAGPGVVVHDPQRQVREFLEGVVGPKPKRGVTGLKTAAKSEMERGLSLEVGIPKAGDGNEMRGLDVFRSMTEPEVSALYDGMATFMGEQVAKQRPLRTALSEVLRNPFSKAASQEIGKRWKTMKMFENDPVYLVAQTFGDLAGPISTAAAKQSIVDTFGKAIPGELVKTIGKKPIIVGDLPAGYTAITDIKGFENVMFPVDQAVQIRKWNLMEHDPETFTGVAYLWDRWLNFSRAQKLLSPAWHGVNQVGALWFNWHKLGMRTFDGYRHSWRIMAATGAFGEKMAARYAPMLDDVKYAIALPWEGGRQVTLREMRGRWLANGIQRKSFFEKELKSMPRGITRIDEAVFNANYTLGGKLEEFNRGAAFVDMQIRGFSPFESGRKVSYAHYIPENLGKMERATLGRVFLFWAWTRNNIPGSIKGLLQTPRDAALIQNVMENIEHRDQMPPAALVPDWIRRGMGIRLEKVGNTDRYFLLGKWLPAADVARLADDPLMSILESTTPGLKGFVEAATGKPLDDRWWDRERFPGEVGEFMGMPIRKREIRLLRQLRVLNELDRMIGPALAPTGAERRLDVHDTRTALVAYFLGAKAYDVPRDRAAQHVGFEVRRKMNDLRSSYYDAAHREDWPNMRRVSEIMAEYRMPIPTGDEIARNKKLRERSREKAGAVGAALSGI